ncbi:MAG: response regulator [Deltaproteobacteria bacterium]|nr:response regulator [Deltaproteobacteria bacterium]
MEEKVLLVDDEKDFLDALGERMANRGMNVSTTTSAKDAVKKVQEESYDAIVLDLQMPEMDGIEALKAIKKINPDMQVILLTGHATVEKGIEAMKLGAMDLIEKPADIETIAEKIKKAQANKMILVEKKTEQKIRQIMSTKAW